MSARIPLPHDLAARPFTLQEGLDRGLGDKRLRGADLQHPYRGVRIASSTTLTLSELCHALQSKLPRYASFCGVTAAVIMGIPLPMPLEQSRVLHVCVPSPHRAPVGKYIHGHAFRISPGDVRAWHGLRLTTPNAPGANSHRCSRCRILSPQATSLFTGDYLLQPFRGFRMPRPRSRGGGASN